MAGELQDRAKAAQGGRLEGFTHHLQETRTTCGPAVVRMVVEGLLGEPWAEADLARAMSSDAEGTPTYALQDFVRGRGLRGTADEGGRGMLAPSCRHQATIVCYRMPGQEIGHYAVVRALRSGKVVLHDPWFGPDWAIPSDDFAARWGHVEGRDGPLHEWRLSVSTRTSCACVQDPLVSREAILPHGARKPSMARADCRNCGHKHFNQGVGPCRDCFCTSFRGYARVSRAARSRVPPGSHLEHIMAARGGQDPGRTGWGW